MIVSLLDASGGNHAHIITIEVRAANADSAAGKRVDQHLLKLAGDPAGGENSRMKLQNVLTDSTAVGRGLAPVTAVLFIHMVKMISQHAGLAARGAGGQQEVRSARSASRWLRLRRRGCSSTWLGVSSTWVECGGVAGHKITLAVVVAEIGDPRIPVRQRRIHLHPELTLTRQDRPPLAPIFVRLDGGPVRIPAYGNPG